ncbi:hypothetical protein N7492_008230 [Penicillium capsulatum]|uniref:RNA polymerase II holoenzyme cyclin-like subunit n=1 Tax=Penicillium capsulatum TaxID=69766 RepID=A0A9W9LGV7_9EURO|nr:hypothetical protein N7492_008230 [Penicillium capsulatum]KAJ6105640.1 hypothetical protein N7512_009157 [Penicillium capsulatum]
MEPSASPAPTKRRIPGLANPVIAAAHEKWLFTDEELERTPSRIDNIEREKEDYIRHRAVEFIWQVSMMLKMPPQTSMTATVFMHRFLMRYSLRGQYPELAAELMHPKVIAAVALFVAFKVDETMRRMRDFVVACCRVAMKQPDLVVDEQSKDYWKWRDLILQNEGIMLEYLCFDLQLESPYRILWDYSLFLNVGDNRPLRHAAYAFLNDSTYTVLCLQFQPRVIAAAGLYAAARHCKVSFPDDAEGHPWWDQIDVRIEDLIRACQLIVKIYERVQQNLSKAFPDFSISDADSNDPTRLFHSNPTSTHEPTPQPPSLNTSTPDPTSQNGRKRSREPDSQPAEPHHPTPTQDLQFSLNGGRSPKRQRTVSPHPATGSSAEKAPSRPRIPLRAMGTTPAESKGGSNPTSRPNGRDPPSGVSSFHPPCEETSAEEGEISDAKDPAPPKETPAEASVNQEPQSKGIDEDGGSEEGEI